MTDQDWQARALEVANSNKGNWVTSQDAVTILAFAKKYAAEALAEVERWRASSEAFALRVLGQERYDNSPCQANPLELVELEIADLRAQLAAATGAGWKPIATAPKDTWILVSCAAGGMIEACKPDIPRPDYEWQDSYGSAVVGPTHWQPLPAPPKESG